MAFQPPVNREREGMWLEEGGGGKSFVFIPPSAGSREVQSILNGVRKGLL